MSRYIKKFKSTTALGPTEERGVAMWAGYDIQGVDGDLSHAGLVNVDHWSEELLRERGVVSFTRVTQNDQKLRTILGITEKPGTG